jgi:G3E family GTPase
MQNRTPHALITGSLGSGKTTLLKRIIRASKSKLAVLINEFGEIGIDGRIIKGEHTRTYNPTAAIIATERCAGVKSLLFQTLRALEWNINSSTMPLPPTSASELPAIRRKI